MRLLEILAVGMVRAYQWFVRPILPMSCRYWPSCSEYAIEAVQRHGVLRGGLLSVWRVARCHPWGGEGLDPVPDRFLGTLGRSDQNPRCGTVNHDHI